MIYLLLGASGTGKTSLGQYLKEWGIPELISTTTRQQRHGESEGEPYYFVTEEEFRDTPMIEVTYYNHNWYGTSRAEVERVLGESNTAFSIVDAKGVDQFINAFGEQVKVIYVWVEPAESMKRMGNRGDSEDDIIRRIKQAKDQNEFENLVYSDYCIVNRNLQDSTRQLKAIVQQDLDTRYLDRILNRFHQQEWKGIHKYGQVLEQNHGDPFYRLEHLAEELTDGLMYIEWIKDYLKEV